jgi:hypothetical protein
VTRKIYRQNRDYTGNSARYFVVYITAPAVNYASYDELDMWIEWQEKRCVIHRAY